MLSDTHSYLSEHMHTHTHSLTLSLIQLVCQSYTRLDEHIKVWNEEIKSRAGMRKLLDNPVILSQ